MLCLQLIQSLSDRQTPLQSMENYVSQNKILLNRKFLKFHSNFLEGFRVALKTFLGLAVPNQYRQIVMRLGYFWLENPNSA